MQLKAHKEQSSSKKKTSELAERSERCVCEATTTEEKKIYEQIHKFLILKSCIVL